MRMLDEDTVDRLFETETPEELLEIIIAKEEKIISQPDRAGRNN